MFHSLHIDAAESLFFDEAEREAVRQAFFVHVLSFLL
jgi:hypothetical protein